MLLVAAASFVLLVAVVSMIGVPLLRPDTPDELVPDSSLVAAKERLLGDIRDLDLDLETGKLDEQDHRRLRAVALAGAAETIRAIEDAERPNGGPVDDAVEPAPPVEAGDPLEVTIAARKRALALAVCPSCMRAVEPGDAFCRRCGAELPAPARR